MKFPKNRANVFLVVRSIEGQPNVVVAVFSSVEEADYYATECESTWKEATNNAPAEFDVDISTYYG